MPAKSQQQLRAMFAAAEGKSTLGIPKKVGAEFVAATPKPSVLPVKAPAMKKPRALRPPKLTMPGDEPLQTMHTSAHH